MRRISFVLISCVSKKISAIKIKRIGKKNFVQVQVQVQVHRATSIEYQLKYLFNMNQESFLIFADNYFCLFILL